MDSAELCTIRNCTTALTTALQNALIIDSDFVDFLYDKAFISERKDVHDHLVDRIHRQVEKDPASYHLLVHYFMMHIDANQSLLYTLGTEYMKQWTATHNRSQGTVCSWALNTPLCNQGCTII